MTSTVSLRHAKGTYVLRAGGAVIGETTNAIELLEGDYPPVIYFPMSDLAMAFLDASKTTSSCPRKGEAKYYSIQTKSVLIEDAGWVYAEPKAELAAIADYIAFYPDKATVEHI